MKNQRVRLERLKKEYLDCHLYGHAWEFVRDDRIVTGINKVPVECTQVDQCLRCEMFRLARVSIPSFALIGSYSYDDPGGYYVEMQDGQRVTRQEFRAEHGRRRNKRFQTAVNADRKNAKIAGVKNREVQEGTSRAARKTAARGSTRRAGSGR